MKNMKNEHKKAKTAKKGTKQSFDLVLFLVENRFLTPAIGYSDRAKKVKGNHKRWGRKINEEKNKFKRTNGMKKKEKRKKKHIEQLNGKSKKSQTHEKTSSKGKAKTAMIRKKQHETKRIEKQRNIQEKCKT